MVHLAELWPRAVPFDDLLTAARAKLGQALANPAEERTLATRLLNCYVSQLVEFSRTPPRFTVHVSPRPIASPWARLRAALDSKVTTLRLDSLTLSEPARLVLRHLDGAHDQAALAALLATWIVENPPQPDAGAAVLATPEALAAQYVAQILPVFAQSALLTD